MKKLVVLTALSVTVQTCFAVNALAEPDTTKKRSLAMTVLPLPVAPRPVPKTVRPSAAWLRKKAQSAYPSDHFSKGMYYKGKGNLDGALIEFLKSSQDNPKQVRAFYEQALIFRERRFLKLAESALEEALAVKDDYQEARILLATVRIQQGNVAGAMEMLSRTLGLPTGTMPTTTSSATKTGAKTANKTNAPDQIFSKAPAILQSLHTFLTEIPSYLLPASQPQNVKPRDEDESRSPNKHPLTIGSEDSSKDTSANDQQGRAAKSDTGSNEQAKTGLSLQQSKQSSTEGNSQLDKTPSADADINSISALDQGRFLKRIPKSLKFHRKKSHNNDDTVEPAVPLSAFTGQSFNNAKPTGQATSSKQVGLSATPDPSTISDLIKTSSENISQNNDTPAATDRPRPGTAYGDTVTVVPNQMGEYHRRHTTINFEPANASEAPGNEKPAFQLPQLPSAASSLIAPLSRAQEKPVPTEAQPDEWTVRLKYLEEHGTASLKEGEAFMFSEDTGEAALFLPDGQTIRRKVADARDENEVVRERRPDILIPEDLMYNLSLLGKLMPHPNESEQPQAFRQPQQQQQASSQPTLDPGNRTFDLKNLMGSSQGFWGWMKKALNF